MSLKIKISLIYLVSTIQLGFSQYKFNLPQNTDYNSGYAVVNNNQYVRIFNNLNKRESFIEFYDLETGKLNNQLTFKALGLVESFYLESNKTIWLFDENKGALIKTVNGVKRKEIDVFGNIPVPKSGYYPYAADMKWSPLHFYNNSFYFINSFDRTSKIPIRRFLDKEFIQSVDISTNRVKSNASIPWLFFDRDYGIMNKFSSLRKDNILIIAPNFSNEIMLYNLENGNLVSPILDENNTNYYAAKPLLTKKDFDISNISEQEWFNKMQQHYSANNEYINIIYDPFKKQYYRTLVVKDYKLKKEIILKIIVLNDKFNFVKEHNLGLDYKPDGMFVTKKGLNVLNYRKYKENSDYLYFDTFNL